MVLPSSSGSGRPRGVTKWLRDDTLLSLQSKDKCGLLLRKCEVGVCTRGNGYNDTDSAIPPTPQETAAQMSILHASIARWCTSGRNASVSSKPTELYGISYHSCVKYIVLEQPEEG
jgi:hypothetical protein